MVIDAIGQATDEELAKMHEQMGEPRMIEKVKGEWWVMVPCQCDPPRAHGPHWITIRRLKQLRGRLRFEDINIPGV